MKKLILAFIFITSFVNMRGQSVAVDHPFSECHASFISQLDPFNPMKIHFEDKSVGQIANWQWNFGDGVTSTMQNPVHTYASGGTYWVCLTISTNGSVICHDMLCLAVTIHEPGMCIADFRTEPDFQNPMRYRFTDKSSGNVNQWYWTFGDGTSSTDRNPTHIYMLDGKYQVCLTVFHDDTSSICHDVKCDSIYILPPPGCNASFVEELDSNGITPRLYRFSSTSTGNPNTFHWTFGDGTSADGPVAQHIFSPGESYYVCLMIMKNNGGNVLCTDTVCRQISMPDYFDLGGHLFIGQQPINNPVSTGDTGLVLLYRKSGDILVPVDTNRFTQLGYYTFPQVVSGNYLLKAGLATGSAHYSEFIPTYYGAGMKWQEAGILPLKSGNNFQSHIYLLQADTSVKGEGKISGSVIWGEPKVMETQIPNCEVILLNADYQPVTFCMTDQNGQYKFGNLSFGEYYLYVDFPGKFSRMTAIWLDETIPAMKEVVLGVFDHDVTGISDQQSKDFSIGNLYPNPTNGLVNMQITSTRQVNLTLELYDLQGRKLILQKYTCKQGSTVLTFQVDFLSHGVYLLRIIPEAGQRMIVRKLIR